MPIAYPLKALSRLLMPAHPPVTNLSDNTDNDNIHLVQYESWNIENFEKGCIKSKVSHLPVIKLRTPLWWSQDCDHKRLSRLIIFLKLAQLVQAGHVFQCGTPDVASHLHCFPSNVSYDFWAVFSELSLLSSGYQFQLWVQYRFQNESNSGWNYNQIFKSSSESEMSPNDNWF